MDAVSSLSSQIVLFSARSTKDASEFVTIMFLDESDRDLVLDLSRRICELIPKVFDSELSGHLDLPKLHLHIKSVSDLNEFTLFQFLELIDASLGADYNRTMGNDWKKHKLAEMSENGLVYIWYTDQEKKVLGFISFMMTNCNGIKVLYLYEIHVGKCIQNRKFGKYLIKRFHSLSDYLNERNQNPENVFDSYLDNAGTALTVFSQNMKALDWYFRLGYEYTPDSPRDRTLRKRVYKPDYYLLWRSCI